MVCPRMHCETRGGWTCLVSRSEPHMSKVQATADEMTEGVKAAEGVAEGEIRMQSQFQPLLRNR
jgi:hypothetical protein